MAMHFDVGNIKNWKTVCSHPTDSKKWHPVTSALIEKSMSVDLGDINDRNVDEWWYRLRLLQLLDGAEIKFEDGTEIFLTYRDVKMHVGLRTNVSTKARTYWLKRMFHPSQRLRPLQQEQTAHELLNARVTKLANKELATTT